MIIKNRDYSPYRGDIVGQRAIIVRDACTAHYTDTASERVRHHAGMDTSQTQRRGLDTHTHTHFTIYKSVFKYIYIHTHTKMEENNKVCDPFRNICINMPSQHSETKSTSRGRILPEGTVNNRCDRMRYKDLVQTRL